MTEFELSSYDIPASNSDKYVMDYLIPLSLGGANTVSNVWPQPRGQVEKKVELEARVRLRVCQIVVRYPSQAADVLANAQHFFAEDWTAAYDDYVSP